MRIEPFQKEHIASLESLEKECFGQTAWSEDGFLEELHNPDALAFTALEHSKPLGCIFAYRGAEQCFISKVMVTPACRRQGVARALLCALESAARDAGMLEMTLEVRESNEAAIALYTACGFQNLGKRRNFYRYPKEDAVIMTKNL